jgi:gamma-glutamyltranspeptidase / glutathione hydrolase
VSTRFENMRARIGAILLVVPLVTACEAASQNPSPASGSDIGKRAVAVNGMVSSAHPMASEAGVEMLRRGGNAVDAAVATAFAVSVGEPQMSGLGGGGGMLIWLQEEGRAEYIDFYSAQRVQSWNGVGPPLEEDDLDLRGVAIPGAVAGLLDALERYGTLSRAEVLEPAIRMAEEGFPVNQILAEMTAGAAGRLERYPASRALLWRGDQPLQPGDILRNPELAVALRRIADQGRAGFYEGEMARQLVEALAEGGHPSGAEDLAAYEPQWKRPLCGQYRDHVVLSAPPPQTGIQLIHTLNLLEPHDLSGLGYPTQSAEAFDVLASAIRLGNTDNRVNSDPNWTTVPAAGATSKAFAAERAAQVGSGRALEDLVPADPLAFDENAPAALCQTLDPYGPATPVTQDEELEIRPAALVPSSGPPSGPPFGTLSSPRPGTRSDPVSVAGRVPAPAELATAGGETTHMSIVDGQGNAVALTQTNSSVFGSGASLSGFFLNDSGIDFSRSEVEGVGNHEWRIRNSTIAPTIVLRDGRVHMVVGAPGGGRIQPAILQSILYVVDYGLDPLDALRMPRMYPSGGQVRVETENGFDASVLAGARSMGYATTPDASGYARIYVIARQGDRWVGAADPRHNGEVRGY